MKNIKHRKKYLRITFSFLLIGLLSCQSDAQSRHDRRGVNDGSKEIQESIVVEDTEEIDLPVIRQATFFFENSASMYGYVSGATSFVTIVNELAQDVVFVDDNTNCSYSLISGKEQGLKIYPKGNDPNELSNILTVNGFRSATSGNSDLNQMFKIALDSAGGEKISFLISDCIYDIGGNNPLQVLKAKGPALKRNFYSRLRAENLATIVVKFKSQFSGRYFPASTPSGDSKNINQNRPYYVWIFGQLDLLTKNYSEEKFKEMAGFVDYALFSKIEKMECQYDGIGYETSGFRVTKNDKKVFEKRGSSHNKNFTVSCAINFYELNGMPKYLLETNHYEINDGFELVKIAPKDELSQNDIKNYLKTLSFEPTHIMSIKVNNPPAYGNIRIKLLNVQPQWVYDSNTDDDAKVISIDKTFGFSTLIKGINDAYKKVSDTEYISEFNLQIINN